MPRQLRLPRPHSLVRHDERHVRRVPTPSNPTCPPAHYCAGTSCIPGAATPARTAARTEVPAAPTAASQGRYATRGSHLRAVRHRRRLRPRDDLHEQRMRRRLRRRARLRVRKRLLHRHVPAAEHDQQLHRVRSDVRHDLGRRARGQRAPRRDARTPAAPPAGRIPDSTAPDSNGCETNLSTANEKVCGNGACVSTGACCTASDCASPPAPAACSMRPRGRASRASRAEYTENSGSVVCCGTCCNAINGTCNGNCTLDCNNGYGHCTGDPAHGCETDTSTTTADCGACARPCSATETQTLSCASGVCNSTCKPTSWAIATSRAPPRPTTARLRIEPHDVRWHRLLRPLCTVPHENGEGQGYTDCADPLGTPGNAATYNRAMVVDVAGPTPSPTRVTSSSRAAARRRSTYAPARPPVTRRGAMPAAALATSTSTRTRGDIARPRPTRPGTDHTPSPN